MSNSIVENGRIILRISNDGLQSLEQTMINLIEVKKIKDSTVLKFIEEMDQDTFGRGMIYQDVNWFSDHPESLKIFTDLVKEAYCKLIDENHYNVSVKEIMDLFIIELQNYYAQIKTV